MSLLACSSADSTADVDVVFVVVAVVFVVGVVGVAVTMA